MQKLYCTIQGVRIHSRVRNIRLTLAYDGTDFYGWQRQPSKPTIQGLMESVLETLLGEQVALIGSGRTDAGVHAANQVANFKTARPIPCRNLVKALNDHLPETVRIKMADEVPLSFHARYSAISKTYRYRILLAPIASPFLARFTYHYPYPLDPKLMSNAARHFAGERDFTSFAACEGPSENAESQIGSPKQHGNKNTRTVTLSRLLGRPKTSILTYEIRGDGFLHHMVRNIVGTLIEVGRGARQPPDIPRILEARDRTLAGPTAPARGLCLWKVEY